jgi:hypothetical protein
MFGAQEDARCVDSHTSLESFYVRLSNNILGTQDAGKIAVSYQYCTLQILDFTPTQHNRFDRTLQQRL